MNEHDDAVAIDDAERRYQQALHGVQSAVAYEIGAGVSTDTTLKHLRVGVNSSLVDSSALAKLLMEKGLFSYREYAEALATAAEDELARYAKRHPGLNFA